MGVIDVRPVRTARERRLFLTFPWRIYRDDPLWVPPLLPERAATIDPERGTFLQRGEAEFFVAWRDGRPVGTICAGEDPPTNERRGKKECVFGFLEFVEDYAVFEALIDRARDWGRERGLDALFGPFNLDYENGYGVLIEGRDRRPALLCGHTPPYYQGFFERYGFEPARADNLAFLIDLDVPTLKRLSRIAEKVRRRKQFVVRPVDLSQWDAEIDRVHYLLNTALAHLDDHIGWHREAVEATLAPFRQIADPGLILFADAGEQTVGWFPGIPDLNEAFARVNGLRYPWDYVKLWWLMQRPVETLTIKSILVLPEYWNTGVAVLLLDEMAKRARARGYRLVEMSITSEDNPNTPLLADNMGARIYKRWRVYRYRM